MFVCLSADESASVYRLEPSTQIALLLIICVCVATGICCSWRPWQRQHRSRVVGGRPESDEGQGRPLFYSEVVEWNFCLASCWQQKMLFGFAGIDFVLLLFWRRVKGIGFRNSFNSQQQQINTFWKYFTQYTKTPSEIFNCGTNTRLSRFLILFNHLFAVCFEQKLINRVVWKTAKFIESCFVICQNNNSTFLFCLSAFS